MFSIGVRQEVTWHIRAVLDPNLKFCDDAAFSIGGSGMLELEEETRITIYNRTHPTVPLDISV